ncbi:MAG TPA: GatB/YqeY domain-containing protein [Prolixibacteraceae bacterium]|nr:GatB/YqeY domain-containing protein [Prolixibacteraceae bacterium]
MTIFEQVSQGIIDAMKAREKEKLEALRNLKKVMIEARSSKGAGTELTDEESLKIIQKLVKQGRDSAEIFQNQNRTDLYDVEMSQVKVLETFLPEQLTSEQLAEIIAAIIKDAGATSIKDMGRVIGLASKQLAGKADGKEIAARVRELLS